MYDLIVQGRAAASPTCPDTQCIASRLVPLKDVLPSPTSLSSTFLLSEITGPQLDQYIEHTNMKKRQLSTDSGVESNHPGTSNNESSCFVNSYNRSKCVVEIHPPKAVNTLSAHDLSKNSTDCKCNALRDEYGTSSNPLEMSNNEPELVEVEINGDVFKSTEQNGNYMKLETFNEMGATLSPCTVQHVGNYVRPETLEWNDTCVDDVNVRNRESCHQGGYDESVSSDSGHDDKGMHSDEAITGSHDGEQDLEFNNDGYVTSPVLN